MIKVRFVEATDEQVRWGGNDDPRPLMKKGDVFTLKSREVHSYHTKLHLVEFPGKVFNSVSFEEGV